MSTGLPGEFQPLFPSSDIKNLQSQRGIKITDQRADALISAAQAIINSL